MKAVLVYEPGDLTGAQEHFPAHRARFLEYHQRGELLMLGPYADPRDGALAIFTTRAAAESFANGDPFVLNGVVGRWYVRDWHEALVPEDGPET